MIRRYLRIYWLYFKQYWKSRLVYKTDFALGAFAQLMTTAVSLAFITLIFTQIESLRGWTFNEMLFLSGFGGMVIFIHNVFLYNVTRVGEEYILNGELDRFLLRPLNVLFQIYCDDIRDNNLPKVIANAALILYASFQIGLNPGIFNVFYGGFAMASGVLTIGAIYLLFSSTAFWTGTSRSAVWLLFRMSEFRKYPYGIYGSAIKLLLVTIVPLAFAIIFPATFVLGKQPLELWVLAVPLFGPLAFLVAYKFWSYGLSNYSSTGS